MRPSSRFAPLILLLTCVLARSAAAAEMHVAVLEFTNASKDPELASLGKGLQSMVTTDLANLQILKVVERERLKDVQGELKLSNSAGFDKTTAAKIGKLAGATHLFVGSFTVVGDKMRLDGRLLVVQSGEVVVAEQIAGEKAYFFELEQKLVEKVIGILGVKPAPKEKAALARPHTADFQAFKKFSDGIQAFDDGRLEEAMKNLNEATAIDKDFKLASLTLEEYERLAAQVRAKAEAAGHVEDELARLEKNKAIAGAVGVLRKLWPLVDAKGNSPEIKLRRVAAACVLSVHYRAELGYKNRGPVTSEDLAKAGFDDFTLHRTADALMARAWAEAPDVFPRIPPLCIGFGIISPDSKEPIEKLLDYQIERAAKLSADPDTLLSYMSNNTEVDPAAAAFHLDAPGEAKLWEKLYKLAERLPKLRDEDRARYEVTIAEHRRQIADFDGSTQMYAAASRHTKDSYKLKEYAKEIDKNKELKIAYAGAPALLQELYVVDGRSDSAWKKKADPAAQQRLVQDVESAREVRDGSSGYLLFGDLPVWRMMGRTMWTWVRTGPRSTRLHTDELRYEMVSSLSPGSKHAPEPVAFVTPVRSRRFTVKAQIDQSAPSPEWRPRSNPPPIGGGEVGVAFAISRMRPDTSIQPGVPVITIGYAVLVGTDRARLVQITRDGEHNVEVKQLADAAVAGRAGRRALEVTVEPGRVSASIDGKRVTFPWKPERDADGFVGFFFNGPGYASISKASIAVK